MNGGDRPPPLKLFFVHFLRMTKYRTPITAAAAMTAITTYSNMLPPPPPPGTSAPGPSTKTVNGFRTSPAMLVAFTVKLNVPPEAGVPDIRPVVVFSVRPGGSAPVCASKQERLYNIRGGDRRSDADRHKEIETVVQAFRLTYVVIVFSGTILIAEPLAERNGIAAVIAVAVFRKLRHASSYTFHDNNTARRYCALCRKYL